MPTLMRYLIYSIHYYFYYMHACNNKKIRIKIANNNAIRVAILCPIGNTGHIFFILPGTNFSCAPVCPVCPLLFFQPNNVKS